MLFHLRGVWVKLGANAGSAHAGYQRQQIVGLTLAEVHKEQLGGSQRVFGIEIKLVQDIVNAICAEGDPDAGKAGHTEDACQVVVPTAARNASDLRIEGLDFENGSGVVIEAARQCEIGL